MTPGKKNVGTNFPKPLFQSEEAIYMKIIFFYSHANRTHFHNKGWPRFKSRVRVPPTRKCPIVKGQSSNPIFFSSADPE